MDIVPIIWNRDTNDYLMNGGGRTGQQVLADVDTWIASSNPNGILALQHDRFEATAAIGPQVHAKVVASNYQAVTVSQCINTQNRGSAYATKGKLYQLVTGYESESKNPNVTPQDDNNNNNSRSDDQPSSGFAMSTSSALIIAVASLILNLF